MPKPLAVFAADTHLADRLWTSRDMTGDAYASFAQLVDAALKYRVPLVLAGDIFDSHVNRSRAVTFAYGQLDRLHAAGLEAWYVNGNHDQSDPPWLDAHPAARHLHLDTVKLGPFTAWGLDYTPAPLLQVALAQAPDGITMAVCHQPWLEFRKGGGGAHGSFADVCKAHRLFTGDLHEYKWLTAVNRGGRPMEVLSPGSTCLTSVDEADDVKTASVWMDDGSWRRLKLKTRRRLIVDAADEAGLGAHLALLDKRLAAVADATRGYDERVRRPILWVRYPWHVPDVRERVAAAAGDRAWLFFRELSPDEGPESSDTSLTADAVASPWDDDAVTMAGSLDAYLGHRPELAAAADDCRRLLAAADSAAELETIYREATDAPIPGQGD